MKYIKLFEEKEAEPTERELFLKYYSSLYIRKDYNELTIWKAFDDEFIDKEDAIELISKWNKAYFGSLYDYCAIQFYRKGLITKEQLCLKYGDLLIHNGELKWFVDKIEDLPGVPSESLIAKILDSDDTDWQWKEWYSYDIHDIWQYCSEKFIKELLEYMYYKEFEYDGETYTLTPDMIKWKNKNPFVLLGEEKVDIDDLIVESFSDIFDELQRAMNRADENAYIDAYYKEAKKIIENEFGEYEQIKHNNKYVYIFDLYDYAEIVDYMIDNWNDLEGDQFSTFNGLLSDTIHYDKKVELNGYYLNGDASYSVGNDDFAENAIDCFAEEGIEKTQNI